MPEPRLYDALELMKQGKKKQAILLVRDILRQDRQNLAAWWLMANLLDDEDKVLKCLQYVLEINPEHRGARQKLATLRPDMLQAFAPIESVPKLRKEYPPPQKLSISPQASNRNLSGSILARLASRKISVILVLIIILFAFGLIAVILSSLNRTSPIADDNGNTPQQITEEYIRAIWLEDTDTLYSLSCPEYYSQIDSIVINFSGYDYSQWTLDTSQTNFTLFYISGNQAYVTINGLISMSGDGEILSTDWNKDAKASGYAGYGEHLYRSDGIWQICTSRDVPNIQSD